MADTKVAEGAGDAHAPTIVVENNPAALSAALEAALAAYEVNEPARQVAAATERVRKAREALAHAEALYASTIAEYGG